MSFSVVGTVPWGVRDRAVRVLGGTGLAYRYAPREDTLLALCAAPHRPAGVRPPSLRVVSLAVLDHVELTGALPEDLSVFELLPAPAATARADAATAAAFQASSWIEPADDPSPAPSPPPEASLPACSPPRSPSPPPLPPEPPLEDLGLVPFPDCRPTTDTHSYEELRLFDEAFENHRRTARGPPFPTGAAGHVVQGEALVNDLPGGVVALAASPRVTVALLADGRIHRMALPMPIRQIACGTNHVVALADVCTVWSWGNNMRGQLGYDTPGTAVTTEPREVESLIHSRPFKVFAGFSQTVVLVRPHGARTHPVGFGQRRYSVAPVAGDVDDVACGDGFTLLRSTSGELFAAGANQHGQLGLGHAQDIPEPVRTGPEGVVVTVAAAGSDTTALIANGTVYFSGRPHGDALIGQFGRLNQTRWVAVDGVAAQSVACNPEGPLEAVGVDGTLLSAPELLAGAGAHVVPMGKHGLPLVLVRDNSALLGRLAGAGPADLVTNDLLEECSPDAITAACAEAVRRGHAQFLLAVAECMYGREFVIDGALLRLAASIGHLSCVEALCAQIGARTDILDQADPETGRSALGLAAASGHRKCVEVLARMLSDKNAKDNQGQTPLHAALARDGVRLPLAKWLVSVGAELGIRDNVGKTPLEYCDEAKDALALKQEAVETHCFISYAHADVEAARALKSALQRRCLRCWMDDTRLGAGADWRSDIGHAIASCKVVVFLASPISEESEWCLKELTMAGQLDRPVLQLPIGHVDSGLDPFADNVRAVVRRSARERRKLGSHHPVGKQVPSELEDDIVEVGVGPGITPTFGELFVSTVLQALKKSAIRARPAAQDSGTNKAVKVVLCAETADGEATAIERPVITVVHGDGAGDIVVRGHEDVVQAARLILHWVRLHETKRLIDHEVSRAEEELETGERELDLRESKLKTLQQYFDNDRVFYDETN